MTKSVQFSSFKKQINLGTRNGSACGFQRDDSLGAKTSRSNFKLNLTHLSKKNKKIQEINNNLLKGSKSHNNLIIPLKPQNPNKTQDDVSHEY